MVDFPNNLAGLSLEKLDAMALEISLEDKLVLLVVREHMRIVGMDVRGFIVMLSELSVQALEEFSENLASMADFGLHDAGSSEFSSCQSRHFSA